MSGGVTFATVKVLLLFLLFLEDYRRATRVGFRRKIFKVYACHSALLGASKVLSAAIVNGFRHSFLSQLGQRAEMGKGDAPAKHGNLVGGREDDAFVNGRGEANGGEVVLEGYARVVDDLFRGGGNLFRFKFLPFYLLHPNWSGACVARWGRYCGLFRVFRSFRLVCGDEIFVRGGVNLL